MNFFLKICYFFIFPLLIYINLRFFIPIRTLSIIIIAECAFLALGVIIYYGKEVYVSLKSAFPLTKIDYLIIGIEISWTVLFFCQFLTYFWFYTIHPYPNILDEIYTLLIFFSCIAAIAHLMAPKKTLFPEKYRKSEIFVLCSALAGISFLVIKYFSQYS